MVSKNKLSRRDFLKISGVTLGGLSVSACGVNTTKLPDTTAARAWTPFPNLELTPTAIASIQLTQAERAFLDNLGTLQVLVDDNFPPITYYNAENDKFEGIGVDVLQILADMLQFKYHIIRDETLTWSDRLDKIKRNEIHLLVGASRNASREEYGVFTTHEYFTVNYALIKAIDNPQVYVTSLSDIKNYRVGLSEGAALNDFILTLVSDPTKITHFPSKEMAFQALKRHEIDLYPFNEAVFKEEFFGGALFDFEIAFSIKDKEQTKEYAFFCPKTEGGMRLISLLDKGMESIDVDKIIAQRYQNKSNFALYKEHFEDLRRQNELKTVTQAVLGAGIMVSLAIIAVIVVWNRRLSIENLKRRQAEEIIRQLNVDLEQMAMTDTLTRTLNRRAFFIRGKEELHRAKRYHYPLSFMVIDIDRFKSVNDTYGHAIGDQVIRAVAEILTKNIRDVDVLARLGGEEFVVMLPNTELTNAVEMAERLRLAVENISCLGKEMETGVTVSIGVAAMRNAAEAEEVELSIKDADIAMYKAKSQGRNRVAYLDPTAKL